MILLFSNCFHVSAENVFSKKSIDSMHMKYTVHTTRALAVAVTVAAATINRFF